MRRSTLVILLLFLGIAGAYYYFNNRTSETEVADIAVTFEPTVEVMYLFKAEDGAVDSIRLESKAGEVTVLERNAENVWAVILPIEASADQGSVEAAATQLAAIRIEQTLSASVPAKDVGLDTPEYTIALRFASGVERKAIIGVLTPSEAGYYAALEGAPQIFIINRDAVDVLAGLLTNPPYAVQTPTPPPSTP